MIIDTHVHMGVNEVTGELYSGEFIVSNMKTYGVDKSIVFSTRIKNPALIEHQNEFVLKECEKYSDMLTPYYFFVPSATGINFLLRTIDCWAGIKLYPNRNGYFASPFFVDVINIANKHRLPLIIHTDTLPGLMDETIAAVTSDVDVSVPIVFCHAFHLHQRMLSLVAQMDNWYIDCSPWVTMLRFFEDCLVAQEERFQLFQEDDILSTFAGLFSTVQGKVLWGTDLYDGKTQSFGAEVKFYQTLPHKMQNTIVNNSLSFIGSSGILVEDEGCGGAGGRISSC